MEKTKANKNEYLGEYREALVAHGICIQCGRRNISVASKCRCDECMEKNAEAARKCRPQKGEAGYEEYREKANAYRRNMRENRKAEGRCPICGKSAYNGHIECYEHMLKSRRYARQGNPPKGYQELGLCRFCGKEPVKGKRTCPEHYEILKNRMLENRQNPDGNHYFARLNTVDLRKRG